MNILFISGTLLWVPIGAVVAVPLAIWGIVRRIGGNKTRSNNEKIKHK